MYYPLSSKLCVVTGTDQFSAAIAMNGDNAVQLEATVFTLGGATSLTLDLQGSNDTQNWSSITVSAGLVLGYSAPNKSTGVGYAFVRVRYSGVDAGTIIVASGLNTSRQ